MFQLPTEEILFEIVDPIYDPELIPPFDEDSDVEKHGTHDQADHGNWARGGVSTKLTQSVLDRVKANGGLSVNMKDGSEPSKGYMVASPVKKAPIVDADDFYDPVKGRKILGDFVKANKKDLGTGKKFLGLWHNKEDNKVYLDVSENVQDRDTAVRLGRQRNQISIWDVVNFEEIGTGGTGVTKEGRNSDGGSTIEYIRDDRRTNRFLGESDLRQTDEVEKHGTHDQSSHAGSRRRIGTDTETAQPKKPKGEQDVTDPNAPKPKLKPGRKPDASGTLEQRAEKLANGERIQVSQKEAKQIMEIMSRRQDNPDLTNMHVEDTQLYDEDNLGIPRNKMPQVPSDTKATFIGEMEKRGARVQRGVADPSKLHPIQAEMSASKVGLIMKSLREKGVKTDDGGRIIISKDNYVIDGHHRWAAAAMLTFENPGLKLPVIKVDMNHKDLIDATLAWNEATGIRPIGMGESNQSGQLRKWAEFDSIVAKAVRQRTIIRFQPGLKPTLKHLMGQHPQETHGSWAGYKSGDVASWGEKRAKALKASESLGPTKEEILQVLTEKRGLTAEEVGDIATSDELRRYVENENDELMNVYQKIEESEEYLAWKEENNKNDAYMGSAQKYDMWSREDADGAYKVYERELERYVDRNAENLTLGVMADKGYLLSDDGSFIDATISSDLDNDFIEKMSEVYTFSRTVNIDGEEVDMSSQVDNVTLGDAGKKIFLRGSITDDTVGGQVGRFQRTIRIDKDGTLVVDHDLLEIDSTYQNKGFGGSFIMQQENYYISHGFDKVYVHAALEEGGYAWAKSGFQWDTINPDNETWSKTRISERMDTAFNNKSTDDTTRTILKDWSTRLQDGNSDNDPEPWEIASIVDSSNQKIGKDIMEGSNWYGVKYLTPSGRKNNVGQSDLAQESSYTAWRTDDKVEYNQITGQVKGQIKLDVG